MLQCADGTIYTGSTTDLKRRFAEHSNGTGARYTASRRPLKLIWAERRSDRSTAQIREAEIKRLSRKLKLATIRETERVTLERFLMEDYTCARFVAVFRQK